LHDTFLYETKSSLFYLLLFSLNEIQGQLRRPKSSVLLAPDVGDDGLNYHMRQEGVELKDRANCIDSLSGFLDPEG
jgi:hypothetical protein